MPVSPGQASRSDRRGRRRRSRGDGGAAADGRRVGRRRARLARISDFFYRPLRSAEPFGLGEVLRFDLPASPADAARGTALGTFASVDADDRRIRTSRNATFDYDALLIAAGARPREAVPGALTFRGEVDVTLITGLLDDLDRGLVAGSSSPFPAESPGRCRSTSSRS